MCHCSSEAQLDCDLTMSFHCELVILILALTLHAQVHTGEIYGGHEAAAHSRPYMVLLDFILEGGKRSLCGGFLLSEDFVMTAAHCQAKEYEVSLGLHEVRPGQPNIQNPTVAQQFSHENYSKTGYKNDLMLLKLNPKAHITENVKSITLAARGDGSLPKSCSVSGWGIFDQSKGSSPKLREVNVTLIDSEQPLKEKSYCSKGGSGPAPGDTGGPLVCEDGKAYGVVSRRLPSDKDIYCYTKISEYRDWIDGIMKHN